jgi:hypothetical protein
MLEQIGLEKKIERNLIQGFLSEVFGNLRIHYFDQGSTWKIENDEKLDSNSIAFTIFKNNSEFPRRVEILRTTEANSMERGIFLAKLFSEKFNCSTITNFSDPENPDDPYACLIFKNGKSYLGDDMHSVWAEGNGDKVKIVKEIEVEDYSFDKKGNLRTANV